MPSPLSKPYRCNWPYWSHLLWPSHAVQNYWHFVYPVWSCARVLCVTKINCSSFLPFHRTVASARIEAPRRRRGGGECFTGVPLPNWLGSLGERCAFLAYLRPTEQPIKAQFFVKSPLDRLGGHGHWTISPWLFFSLGQGHSALAGGHGPPWPPWLRACPSSSTIRLFCTCF